MLCVVAVVGGKRYLIWYWVSWFSEGRWVVRGRAGGLVLKGWCWVCGTGFWMNGRWLGELMAFVSIYRLQLAASPYPSINKRRIYISSGPQHWNNS